MPARLHHERIARSDAAPERWLMMTHGFFGAGSNLRGIARKITERRRDWGIVLVDLRQHGRSEPGEPPHTIAACADDVRALHEELCGGGTTVMAIAGHSFGGKVVLAARAAVAVRQTWVLDSSPSASTSIDALADPDNTVPRVLGLLERLPKVWPRREDFVAAVVADGHDLVLGQWLAMNLAATGDTYALRLDLVALRALLADYYATDLWSSLDDPAHGDAEIVIATRSTTVSADDRRRLAAAPAHVHPHHIDAGHWLHIEAAPAVSELFATLLP